MSALLMMRTVALYQRSKYILGLMGFFLILGCGTIIVGIHLVSLWCFVSRALTQFPMQLSITSYQSSVHFTGSLAKMLPGCVFPMTKEQYGFACMYHAARLTNTDRTERELYSRIGTLR